MSALDDRSQVRQAVTKILVEERERSSNIEKNFKWVKKSLLKNIDIIPETSQPKRQISVLLICIPCGGFGDIIFCMKIKNYLKQWFNCIAKIATTSPDRFKGLGENIDDIYSIESTTKNITDCVDFNGIKKFHNFSAYRDFYPIDRLFDLIFITPRFTVLGQNMFTDIKNLQHFIPYANIFNTYFFSEYDVQPIREINFDFLTGLGKRCLGILLTDCPIATEPIITTPYCFAYIAQLSDRPDVKQSSYKCYLDFFKLVFQKYLLFNDFTVVIPNWIFNDFRDIDYTSEVWKLIKWKTIIFKNKNIFQLENSDPESAGTLTLDASRFPCSNKEMINLMYYSQDDILVTGDQSITDVISCALASDRFNQKIWYQRVPWKNDFIKEFSNASCSDGALENDDTSCGTLDMRNVCDLKKVKDFRVYGRQKLEQVMKLVTTLETEIFKLDEIIKEVEKNRKNTFNCDEEFLYKLTTLF